MYLILIILLVLLVAGGIPAYQRRGEWGVGPSGIIGVLVVVLLIVLILNFAGAVRW